MTETAQNRDPSQNIRQDVGHNSGNMQGTAAGQDAYSIQGDGNRVYIIGGQSQQPAVTDTRRDKAQQELLDYVLQPLTTEQIREYILQTEVEELWTRISHDPELLKLAERPLLLNIMVVACMEISFDQWEQLTTIKERLRYLFAAYVQRMFKREYRQGNKQKTYPKPCSDEATRHYLSWLAIQLIREKQTEFLIDKLQPTWLKNRIQKLIYKLIIWLFIWTLFALIFGVGNGVIVGLTSESVIGFIFGLVFGVFYVAATGLIFISMVVATDKSVSQEIVLRETVIFNANWSRVVKFNWSEFRRRLFLGLVVTSIMWLSGDLIPG